MSTEKILIIMAAGKSSRFGYIPKLEYTFEQNFKIFKNHFSTIIIATTPELYDYFSKKKIIKDIGVFSSKDLGRGAGHDVYYIAQKIFKKPLFVAQSDAFFNEENIEYIIKMSEKYPNENCLTYSFRKKPYVHLIKDEHYHNLIVDFKKPAYDLEEGIQDNCIFYVSNLSGLTPTEEFLDFIRQRPFLATKTENPVYSFNTENELKKILSGEVS